MAKTVTKKEQAERTRARIINEAIRLFSRKGFASTSTKDLSTAIGMTQGALYWHFADKDALLTAVLENLQGRLSQELLNASSEQVGERAPSLVQALIRRLGRIVAHNQQLLLLVGTIGAEATDVDPKVERAVRLAYGQLSPLVEAVLDQAKREGVVDRDLDVPCAAQLFMGMCMGGVMHQRLFRAEFPLPRALPVLEQLMVSALLPRAQAPGQSRPGAKPKRRRRSP